MATRQKSVDFDSWADGLLARPDYAGYTKPELRSVWEQHYGLAPSVSASPKEPSVWERAKQGVSDVATSLKLGAANEPEDIAGTVAEAERNALPPTAAGRKMAQEIEPAQRAYADSEGFEAVGKFASLAAQRIAQFASNPREFAGMMAQNLPNSAPGMAGALIGGAVGSVPGAVAGGTAGGYLIEQGAAMRQQIVEEARARGVDPRDPAALEPIVREKYAQFLESARLKGIGTAGADAVLNAVTLGVAGMGGRTLRQEARSLTEGVKTGRLTTEAAEAGLKSVAERQAARSTMAAKAKRGGGVVAAEMVTEPAGEALGQQMAYGQVDALDVIDESLLGAGTGVALAGGRGAVSKAMGIDPGDQVNTEITRARAEIGAVKAREILAADAQDAQVAQAQVQSIMAARSVDEIIAAAIGEVPAVFRDGATIPEGVQAPVSSIAQPLGGDIETPAFERAGRAIEGVEPISQSQPGAAAAAPADLSAPTSGSVPEQAGQVFLGALSRTSPKAFEALVAATAKITGARDLNQLVAALSQRFIDRDFWGQLIAATGNQSPTVTAAAYQAMQFASRQAPQLQPALIHIKDAAQQATLGMPATAANEPTGSVEDVTLADEGQAQQLAGIAGRPLQAVETPRGTRLQAADLSTDQKAVEALKASMRGDTQAASAEAAATGALASLRAVPDAGLPGIALARAFAQKLGRRVVVVDSDGDTAPFNGATVSRGTLEDAGGVLFIHAKTRRPALAVVGHELLHTLSPKLRDQLAKALGPMIGEGKIAEKMKLGLSREAATEEVLADIVGNRFTEASFWKLLERKNPSLFRDFAQRAIEVIGRILEAMKSGLGLFGADEGLSSSSLRRARVVIANALAEHAASLTPEQQKQLGWNGERGGFASNNVAIEIGGRDEPPARKVGRVEPRFDEQPRLGYEPGARGQQPIALGDGKSRDEPPAKVAGRAEVEVPLKEPPRRLTFEEGLRANSPIVMRQKVEDEKAARVVGRAEIDVGEVNTEPSDAQKEAGNYKKGHVSFEGLDISIENPVGSERSGKDASGKPWSVEMTAHYGYVKRTEGADGDQIDVYLVDRPIEGAPVYVFDQYQRGRFDEHKVVLGVATRREAEATYDAHFSDGSGPKRRLGMKQMSMAEFKDWVNNGDTKKAVAVKGSVLYSAESKARAANQTVFEVAPDPRNEELKADWDALSNNAKWTISRHVLRDVLDPAFNAAGVRGRLRTQLGGYGPDSNPSIAVVFDDAADPAKVANLTRLLGSALSQQSMMRTSPVPFPGSFEMNAIMVEYPRGYDEVKLHELYTRIREITDDQGEPYATGHTTAEGVMVILDDGSRIGAEEFARKIAEHLGDAFDVSYDGIHAAFPEAGNDNYGFAAGQLQQGDDNGVQRQAVAGQGGSEASLRQAADQLYEVAQRRLRQDIAVGKERAAAAPAQEQVAGEAGAQFSAESRTGIELTHAQRRASLEQDLYREGDFELQEALPKFANQAEFGEFLNKRLGRDAFAGNYGHQALKHVSGLLAHEGILALGQRSNGAQWYRDSIEAAMRQAAVLYPEIAASNDSRFIFTVALAITSNGQAIADNVRMAFEAYDSYHKDGKFSRSVEGAGERTSTINAGLRRFNDMVELAGSVKAVRAFALTKRSVREIEDSLDVKISGENKDSMIYGGAVFGPKVGGGFLPNLNGIYDALTIDRWLARTYNRLTGNMLNAAGEVQNGPRNGAEREFLRGAFARAVEMMREKGHRIEQADLQALLWYPEKELYTMYGVSDVRAAPTDYEIEVTKYVESHKKRRGLSTARQKPAGRPTAGDDAARQVALFSAEESGPGRGGAAGEPYSRREAVEDAVVAEGVHWSKREGLSYLSGTAYGTGLKGAERERLARTDDARIKRRIYFYIPRRDGTLPLREAGVGPFKYTASLGNLYDPQTGKIGGADANEFEGAVLDAGYDGYLARDMGIAVVLDSDVPVTSHGAASSAPPSATTKIGLLASEIRRIDELMPKIRVLDPQAKFSAGSLQVRDDVAPKVRRLLGVPAITAAPKFSQEFLGNLDDYDVADPYVLDLAQNDDLKGPKIVPEQADRYAARRWLKMAENKAMFTYPVSDQETLENVAFDLAKLKATPWRPADPIERVDGATKSAKIKMPARNGESVNATVLKDNKGNVWVNVIMMRKGAQEGAAVYSIVANYAHNNKLKFIGDPAGLSDDALFRRTENMLASALKFGTTDHLAPHQRQLDAGLAWKAGDTEYNIAAMLAWSREKVLAAVPALYELSYDPATGQVVDTQGQVVDRKGINALLDIGGGRDARAGARTAVRTVATNEFVTEYERGEREATGELPAGMNKVSYSREQTQTPPFKKWFGDSVVTENGKAGGAPLVVYHGSLEGGIKSFKPGVDGAGWFAVDPDVAGIFSQMYDESTIYPAYLAISNPLDARTDEGRKILHKLVDFDNDVTIADQLTPHGYDGMISEEEPGKTTYLAFRPNQIKSAIGNNGQFDPSNSDIRFSADLPEWITSGTPELQSAAGKIDTYAPGVPIGQKVKELANSKWRQRLVQGIADAFAPLKELSREAYIAARMTKSADGVLEGLLLYGKPVMDADGAISGDLDHKGFLGVMKELKGEHDRFFMWLAGNRAERLLAEDREHLFTPAEITAMKRLNQGNMKDGSSREAAYTRALAGYTEYSKSVLDIAEKTGLIDAEGRALWEHDFYVPFYRMKSLDEGQIAGPMKIKGLVRQQAFKKLKGGTEPLGDLMENTLRNWSHLLGASLANQAAVKSLKAAVDAGVAIDAPSQYQGKEMASAADRKNGLVYAMEGGQQRWYVVDDPYVLEAITSLEAVPMGGVAMKVMGKAKHYLTLGVTISPAFKVRNLLRDTVAAIGQNDMSYNMAANVMQGWAGTHKGADDYAQMLFGGALMRFGQLTDGKHAQHVKRLIEMGVDDKTILDSEGKIKGAFTKLWDGWQDFGDRMENINRAALYKQRIAAGDSPLEAAFAARDMMDFSLQGSWAGMRMLTQVVPFLNARVQGLYKLGRAAAADPKRVGYVVGGIVMASWALLLAYNDDEDWKAREDWDRDNFWWIKVGDTAYRIPKPFELGAIGTIAERSLEYFISEEMTGKRFAERMHDVVTQQFEMNPVPQLFKPMIDLYANQDSFTGRQIETMAMERRSKSERALPNTSALARALGEAAPVTGLSPVQIDHLVRAYTGWLGVQALNVVDVMTSPFASAPRPAPKWDDYTMGLAKGLPASSSRYLEQFYKTSQAIHEVMGDIKAAREAQDFERAREIQTSEAWKVQASKQYARAEREMSKINAEIRQVRNSTKLDAETKRLRLEELTQRKNLFARNVSRRMRPEE